MAKKLGCMTAAALCVWIAVSIIGGSMREKKATYTVEELENKALEYMSERYRENDDRFTVEHSAWDSREFEVSMRSDKYANADISVRWNFEEKEFTDNYIAYVLQKDVEEKFQEVFAGVYGEENFRLQYKPGVVLGKGAVFELGVTAEEFLEKMHTVSLSVLCIGDPDEKEEKMQEVLDILYEKGWGVQCRFVYVNEEEVNDWKETSVGEIVVFRKYTWIANVYQTADRSLVQHKWREGKKDGF